MSRVGRVLNDVAWQLRNSSIFLSYLSPRFFTSLTQNRCLPILKSSPRALAAAVIGAQPEHYLP
jgi:hypothetical protein